MTDACHSPLPPWALAPTDETAVAELVSRGGFSTTMARVLVARGHTSVEGARRFLQPSLDRDWLPPSQLPGMDAVADAVASALRGSKRIVVFGDFDLDGISAAAVAVRGLRAMGGDVHGLVPHRFEEGYGLSLAAIERIMELAPGLVITVDCGISSSAEVAELMRRGVAVAVTDHHEPGRHVPVGVPVADPKLVDDAPSEPAGAGVALKLVQAVGERLGFPGAWRELTDLAALGTIGDIVPLVGENRALVADGVARMRTSPRAAVSALSAVAAASVESISSETVAYGFAPRLNAAGRMADPALALALLLTDDPTEAETLAVALDEHNRLRQAAEAELAAAAREQAEATYVEGDRCLILAGEGWHEGVKGIVASRLASQYGVPTLLFSLSDGVASGSGRSVGSVDLYAVVATARDLVLRFGGHAAAVGLALPEDSLPALRERLRGALAALPAEAFEVTELVDAEVSLDETGIELGAELELLEPYGEQNRAPVLAAAGVFMNGRKRVGRTNDHLRFEAFDGTTSRAAIAFRCDGVEDLVECDGPVDLTFRLDVDEWRGRPRTQLIVQRIVPRAAREYEPARELVDELFSHAEETIAREEYAGISDAVSFHTKLVGVTFEGRQDLVSRLGPSAPLRLVRQPENQHDENACALFDAMGDQVGFFNRRLAAALAPAIDAGIDYDVVVTEVTGGDEGRALGVNVLVSRRDAAAEEEIEAAERISRRAELSALPPAQLDEEIIRRLIGEGSLHAAQSEALAHLATGSSTLAVMATGRGKSLIFHMHAAREALRSGGASVFVFPLRALVADQAFHLQGSLGRLGLSVKTLTGESSPSDREESFAAIASGGIDVVLTTPEFLEHHADRFSRGGRVRFVVVDEAHHVGLSRAGHRPAYGRLGQAMETLGRPLVLATTATAGDDVTETIIATLGIEVVVADPTVRENLLIEDKRDHPDRDAYLAGLAAKGEKTIVYVNSREQSVRLARMLRKRIPDLAFRTVFYNGGLARAARHAVEHAFRDGDLVVVIATSAFGEGVNIPDVRNVVLYHLPFGDVEFNQMCGRAGRDGEDARIHLLFGIKDARINEMILSSLAPGRDDMAALYLVLRELQAQNGEWFESTNAELAQAAAKKRKGFGLDERGVSSAIGIFRELGLVTSEGQGPYRRLSVVPVEEKVDLTSSVRYAEGLEEIEEFREFRSWVLSAEPEHLLARFNRPILPTRR